jgi:hypothetical protein
MVAAMIAATGLIGWWRLSGRALPWPAAAIAALLLIYATLVRANALFATVPLACGLFGWFGLRQLWLRAAAMLVLALGIVVAAPAINHHLLGADESGVERTLPIFDLAGIAHFASAGAAPLVPPATWRAVEARHCYTPFFWDPLGDQRRCAFVQHGLEPVPGSALFLGWTAAVVRHPIAYAQHRALHWNATERFLVRRGLPMAAPPPRSEPNALGLGSPGPDGAALDLVGAWLAASPLGWPVLWFAAALAALVVARPARGPADSIAIVLALSAVLLETSFAIVSIAPDLRYHLWPMIAAGLAWILLAGAGLPRRTLGLAVATLFVLTALGAAARLALPPADGTYAEMLRG